MQYDQLNWFEYIWMDEQNLTKQFFTKQNFLYIQVVHRVSSFLAMQPKIIIKTTVTCIAISVIKNDNDRN